MVHNRNFDIDVTIICSRWQRQEAINLKGKKSTPGYQTDCCKTFLNWYISWLGFHKIYHKLGGLNNKNYCFIVWRIEVPDQGVISLAPSKCCERECVPGLCPTSGVYWQPWAFPGFLLHHCDLCLHLFTWPSPCACAWVSQFPHFIRAPVILD